MQDQDFIIRQSFNRRSYFLDNFLNTDDILWKIGQNEALKIL